MLKAFKPLVAFEGVYIRLAVVTQIMHVATVTHCSVAL